MPSVALAVDLGGTNIRCAVVDEQGRILFESRRPTNGSSGPDTVIARIAEMIGDAAAEAGLDGDVAVGIAAPGPLDPHMGIVHFAPNLKGWRNIPLQERIESLTGKTTVLGNDGNAAALGEYYFGSARDIEDLIYVALGTGFGGGVIAGGKLVDGVRGLGAELGHTTVALTGPRCTCGSVGHVEAFCSGWAIARDAKFLVDSGRGDAIESAVGKGEVDAHAVREAATAGDSAAIDILQTAGWALGAGLANFANIFNPSMIVIGGGLAEIGKPLLEPARRALTVYGLPSIVEDVTLSQSDLGTRTGIYGAAALVFHGYSK